METKSSFEVSEEYVANAREKKGKCPTCQRGDNLSVGYLDSDNPEYERWHPVLCRACGTSWLEVFRLVGIRHLEKDTWAEPT